MIGKLQLPRLELTILRRDLYKGGGLYSVTSKILVTDLLSESSRLRLWLTL